MFAERWMCFCCPPVLKPPRRSIVAPLEQVEDQPKSSLPQIQVYPTMDRPKKKSDLSMYINLKGLHANYCFSSAHCCCYYSNMV
jgi:hypothetical protein